MEDSVTVDFYKTTPARCTEHNKLGCGCILESVGLGISKSATQLKRLEVRLGPEGNHSAISTVLEAIARCNQLSILELDSCGQDMEWLARLPESLSECRLTGLRVQHGEKIKLPCVEVLELQSTSCDPPILEIDAPKLKSLVCSMQSCQNKANLVVNAPNLVSVVLEGVRSFCNVNGSFLERIFLKSPCWKLETFSYNENGARMTISGRGWTSAQLRDCIHGCGANSLYVTSPEVFLDAFILKYHDAPNLDVLAIDIGRTEDIKKLSKFVRQFSSVSKLILSGAGQHVSLTLDNVAEIIVE